MPDIRPNHAVFLDNPARQLDREVMSVSSQEKELKILIQTTT